MSPVCPSETIRYRDQIGWIRWNSWKIILGPNSLKAHALVDANMGDLVQREHTPKIRVNRGDLELNYNRVHPNKSPLQMWEKKECVISRDCPIF